MCEQKENKTERRKAFWARALRYSLTCFFIVGAIIALGYQRWSLACVALIMLAWRDIRELVKRRTEELDATYQAFMSSIRVVQHTTDMTFNRIVGSRNLADKTYRELAEGFEQVTKAINNLPLPGLPGEHKATKGLLRIIMPDRFRFRFNEDQAPIDFTISVGDIKSARGTPVDAGDIDLSVESNSPAIAATLSDQQLSEDRLSVSGKVILSGNAMTEPGLAVITVTGKNRDTNAVVAAGTAEFQTGPGEGSMGTIHMDIPLEPVGEAPATPAPVSEPAVTEQPAVAPEVPTEAPAEPEQPAPVDGSGDPV